MIHKNYLPESIMDDNWKSFSYNTYDKDGICDPIFDDSKLSFDFVENDFICNVLLDFAFDPNFILVEISISNSGGDSMEEFNCLKVSKVFPYDKNIEEEYNSIKNWSNNSLYLLLNVKNKFFI